MNTQLLSFSKTDYTYFHKSNKSKICFPEYNILLWGSEESLEILVSKRQFFLNDHIAIWIPANLVFTVKTNRNCYMHMTRFIKRLAPFCWRDVMPIQQSKLLLECLKFTMRRDISILSKMRMEKVIFDIIEPLGATQFEIPIPNDNRISRLVHEFAKNPAQEKTAEEWGKKLGISVRTLSRIIVDETGMSFSKWRTAVKIRESLKLLSQGIPVAVVAKRIGYTTPSAFVVAFKKVTGKTPTSYFLKLK